MLSPRPTLTVCLFAALGACSGSVPMDDPAAEAADSVEHTVTESALLLTAADVATVPGGARAQAAAAAARAAAVYRPPRCVQATAAGTALTYDFTDCTGPVGMTHVSGTLTVTYGVTAAGGLTVHAASTGLRVDGGTFDLDSDAGYTATATGYSLVVQSRSGGVGPRGVHISRAGEYTAAWEPGGQCLTLDGAWVTRVGARTSATRVVALRRCGGHCPQPGGTVTYANGAAGEAVTITFPGGVNALWSTSTRREGTLALTCMN